MSSYDTFVVTQNDSRFPSALYYDRLTGLLAQIPRNEPRTINMENTSCASAPVASRCSTEGSTPFDLRIKCGGFTFQVHRYVVCSKSDFFMKACTGGFEEAKSGIIELPEENPQIVEKALIFMYTRNYDDGISQAQPQRRATPVASQFINVRVYAFADKFLIPGLKNLAADKFKRRHPKTWGSAMGEILREIYVTTPESDRGLRNIILGHCAANAVYVSKNPSCRQALAHLPGALSEIIRYLKHRIIVIVEYLHNETDDEREARLADYTRRERERQRARENEQLGLPLALSDRLPRAGFHRRCES